MRLDKLLSNTGFGSRKDVKILIRKGHVTVNNEVIRSNRTHVNLHKDTIMVKNKRVQYQKHIYLMLNKPKDYLSATEDRHDKTVIDLLDLEHARFQPFPVGRLDKDTEGLLIITNDGVLAHHLTSPKKDVEKTYYARISGLVTEKDVKKLAIGVTLDDGHFTKPASLQIIKSAEQSEVELTITEGKYHQVKRMFGALGKKVVYLKRIRMGNLHLDEQLPLGTYRELTDDERASCLSLIDS